MGGKPLNEWTLQTCEWRKWGQEVGKVIPLAALQQAIFFVRFSHLVLTARSAGSQVGSRR
jgi:hypothetical protein